VLNPVHLRKRKIRNTRSIDIFVKDAFGTEHVLFPNEEKELLMIVTEKKDDRR